MPFKWREFADTHGIEYVSRGANVGKGRINIKCPFCGQADTSQHMGLEEEGSLWACWRSSAHRGGDPAYLVAKLLGITLPQARDVVREGSAAGITIEQARQKLATRHTVKKKRKAQGVTWDEHLLQGHLDTEEADTCQWYLWKRGFLKKDVRKVAQQYGLRFSLEGTFRDRLAVPVRTSTGLLIGWTARTIDREELARYKAYPEGDAVKHGFAGMTKGHEGESLILVEGPLDAVKLDYYAPEGVRALAIMGTSMSPEQTRELKSLAKRYKRVCVSLDPGAMKHALLLSTQVPSLPIKVLMPPDADDFGDCTPAQIQEYIKGVCL